MTRDGRPTQQAQAHYHWDTTQHKAATSHLLTHPCTSCRQAAAVPHSTLSSLCPTSAHAYSRDTRRSETSAKGHFHFLHYFCAPPHAQVGHRVGAHAPTRRSVPGHPAPDSARSVTRSQASRYCTHDASQWRSSETEQLWQSSSLFFRTRHPPDDLSCSSAAALAEDLCEHKPSADGDGAVASRSCRWRSRPRRLERHVERRVDRAASAKRSREHGPHARQPATSSLSLAISASDGNGMKKVRGAAAPRAKVCALVTS